MLKRIRTRTSWAAARLQAGEDGQTIVEYALILVLVAVGSVTFLVAVSGKLNAALQAVSTAI